jgi:microcystin-dependent protein
MDTPYLGSIVIFAGNFAPRGWAYCDGQLLSISQNQALFSILGTTYGGDGRTTFALPDLRGRAAIHAGTGPGLTPRNLGSRSGTEWNYLTSNQLPSHTHSATVTSITASLNVSSAAADHQTPAAGDSLAAAVVPAGRTSDPANAYNASAPNVALNTGSIVATGGSVTVMPTGASSAVNNMQPYEVVHYIIALVGIFPSRS